MEAADIDKHTSLLHRSFNYHNEKSFLIQHPGASALKHNSIAQSTRVFVTLSHFHPGPIFTCKVGTSLSGTPTGLHSNGRLLAFPENIKLGW